jgi:hypothetical protein
VRGSAGTKQFPERRALKITVVSETLQLRKEGKRLRVAGRMTGSRGSYNVKF